MPIKQQVLCSFTGGCPFPAIAKGLCRKHYYQLRSGQALTPLDAPSELPMCTGPECDRIAVIKGLCRGHYAQYSRGKRLVVLGSSSKRKHELCSYKGCNRPVKSLGLCAGHYTQQRIGLVLTPLRYRRSGTTAKRWSAAEDAVIADTSLSARQVAELLGRSKDSITSRRRWLKYNQLTTKRDVGRA